MKKIAIILVLILQFFSILFFEETRSFCYDLNLSWTFSYLFPFILIVLISLVVTVLLKKGKIFQHKILFLIFGIFILFTPFGIAFALNPIYEGDLSNGGEKLNLSQVYEDFEGSDFIVLTIPNCPFCKESTKRINVLKKRNPKLRIKYLVCSSDSRSLSELRPLLNPKVTIKLGRNLSSLVTLSNGKFPCYVKVNQNKAIRKWNNSQLGTMALDWIEDSKN